MPLREDVAADLGTAEVTVVDWTDDPRGEEYGKGWVGRAGTLPAAYQEVGTAEQYAAGRQESDKMVRLFVDLDAEHRAPFTERNRVDFLGRRWEVVSVVSVLADPDWGAIAEVVSV